MTPEQRKRVAELCTEKEWETCEYKPGFTQIRHYYEPRDVFNPDIWAPSFGSQDWQRSQALAVVEWIRDKLPVITAFPDDRAISIKYESAFKSRDIESLLSLVLELSDD